MAFKKPITCACANDELLLRFDWFYTPISKKGVGESGERQLSNGNCTTERNCGFHVWFAKTMSSSRCAKLILPYERPTGPGLTHDRSPEIRNITFHCPFTNAWEKWSLCHWILKNVDKPYDSPSKVSTVWSGHHKKLFPVNIQYPHFFSVVQSPFDNSHSSFSPTTFFEIGVCEIRWRVVCYATYIFKTLLN